MRRNSQCLAAICLLAVWLVFAPPLWCASPTTAATPSPELTEICNQLDQSL